MTTYNTHPKSVATAAINIQNRSIITRRLHGTFYFDIEKIPQEI
jgi:hypothetical protein